jgi:glucose-6-phosphate 1-dehydrogenase
VEPVLGDRATPVTEYEPGTWGPDAAAQLMSSPDAWHNPAPEDELP